VSLAWEIAQECKKRAANYGRTADPPKNSPMDTYSHWLEQAYPQAIQRQRYFRKLIEGKPISHANFRLAHLLIEKHLATLVVTPNFDDFLSRALTLFGQPHIVCDHPNTVERIDPESKEIQIVHVHGTYWFYDCCNLRGEIEARTKDSREQSVTMTSLLDNILSRHSAIVIGYSGWEGDVIVNALKRRLMSGLPNNLYWFCYRRGDLDSVPSFLKNHRDVRLVLPPAPPSKPDTQVASAAKSIAVANELEPTLTAQSVLDKLVGTFTKKAPALTVDPIGFFAGQLLKAFPPDISEKSEEDIYDLRNVISRVERVRERGETKATDIEAEIERVRDANRRSEYRQAIEIAGAIASRLSNQGQMEVLADLALSAASGLDDNSEEELRGYEIVLLLGRSGPVAARPIAVAKALVNKGITLGQLNRSEEAIGAYNELLQRFGDSPEPALREHVGKALYNKGATLGRLNRSEEEIGAYNELLQRFGDSPEPALRERVAKALYNKGITLSQLNRSEEAIGAYNELLQRFGDSPEPTLREHVAKALHNKGVTLGRLDRSEEAIGAYNELLQRFGDSPELALRERVAKALNNKGVTLGQLNRSEEEIGAYNEALRRFGESPEAALREQVAVALVNKGITLGQLNRSEEEIGTYNGALQRFGDSPEPALREHVAKALVNKGLVLKQLKRPDEAKESFREVLKRYADSTEIPLKALVELAKAELESGDPGEEAVPK
jgi:tetratricopeptide (TPR) repeat protein